MLVGSGVAKPVFAFNNGNTVADSMTTDSFTPATAFVRISPTGTITYGTSTTGPSAFLSPPVGVAGAYECRLYLTGYQDYGSGPAAFILDGTTIFSPAVYTPWRVLTVEREYEVDVPESDSYGNNTIKVATGTIEIRNTSTLETISRNFTLAVISEYA